MLFTLSLDITLAQALILAGLGLIAGVINTLAGGGSNLTIPALMVLGMPADIANATNRVGILLQSAVGVAGFKHHNTLPTQDFKALVIPMLIGSFVGSVFAAYAPPQLLKFLLLGAMLSVAGIVLLRPNVIAPPDGTVPFTLKQKPQAWGWLLFAGFYGGFVQAGVGFIMLTAFAGVLRYNLVASNALKMLATLLFTALALVVFVVNGQVQWLPGLILAAGSMLGAYIGVRLALKIPQHALKWFLFCMTLAASLAAIYF